MRLRGIDRSIGACADAAMVIADKGAVVLAFELERYYAERHFATERRPQHEFVRYAIAIAIARA